MATSSDAGYCVMPQFSVLVSSDMCSVSDTGIAADRVVTEARTETLNQTQCLDYVTSSVLVPQGFIYFLC